MQVRPVVVHLAVSELTPLINWSRYRTMGAWGPVPIERAPSISFIAVDTEYQPVATEDRYLAESQGDLQVIRPSVLRTSAVSYMISCTFMF